jgi:hypothetical protein
VGGADEAPANRVRPVAEVIIVLVNLQPGLLVQELTRPGRLDRRSYGAARAEAGLDGG